MKEEMAGMEEGRGEREHGVGRKWDKELKYTTKMEGQTKEQEGRTWNGQCGVGEQVEQRE